MNTQKLLLFLTFSAWIGTAGANVKHIDFKKISNDKALETKFEFVVSHLYCYDHWSAKWEYSDKKADLVAELSDFLKDLKTVIARNAETNLLMGDVAHYLYNMEEQAYSELADEYYHAAIGQSPKDYRGYWFLGEHLWQSGRLESSIDTYKEGQTFLPEKAPVDYWSSYAMAANVTNMPSHMVYAFDMIKKQEGTAGELEQAMGAKFFERFETPNITDKLTDKELWTAIKGDIVQFLSRPLGIKIGVYSTWDVKPYGYNNQSSAFVLLPPPAATKSGKRIGYTMVVMCKVANPDETLDDYIKKFIKPKDHPIPFVFSTKYPDMKSYTIQDPNTYKENGGGRFVVVGLERDAPTYPGLALETPIKIDQSADAGVQYYTPTNFKTRFASRIFYCVILDSCGKIYDASMEQFRQLFEQNMVIE